MNKELDMSGMTVDMIDRPSLKYVYFYLGKKNNARILQVRMCLYRVLQDFQTWCRR